MKINNIKNLLHPIIKNVPNIYINKLKTNSKEINKNDLFIAFKGHLTNGYKYINEAISKKSCCILAEKKKNNKKNIKYINKIPIIYIKKLKEKVPLISSRYYNNPSLMLCLIGVTGTNGKTTITYLLAKWINLIGEKSRIMSSIGNGEINNLKHKKKINTTDSSIDIQKFLYNSLKKNILFNVIEISSHGLIQKRVNNLFFNVAIFTNITIDHLDYHKNIKKYESSKWILFNKIKVKKYIINASNNIGKKWIKKLILNKKTSSIVAVIFNKKKIYFLKKIKYLKLKKIKYKKKYILIIFNSYWGKGIIKSKIIGFYNIKNILLTIATLLALGYKKKLLLKKSKYLNLPDGRLKIFKKNKKPMIIIDYAHNPDSFKNIFKLALNYKKNNICCIFGCGGNRDITKRSIMGEISDNYSNYIILTNDNPRNENPIKIIHEIKTGIKNKNKIIIITNRKKSIIFAIKKFKKNDLILILGKGNENYQILNNKIKKHSDIKTINYFY